MGDPRMNPDWRPPRPRVGHCPNCDEPAKAPFECHGSCGHVGCAECLPLPQLKCAPCVHYTTEDNHG